MPGGAPQPTLFARRGFAVAAFDRAVSGTAACRNPVHLTDREVAAHCEGTRGAAYAPQHQKAGATMRSLLAAGLLIALCAPATAQMAKHARPSTAHPRMRQPLIVRPDPTAVPRARFAVPGWTDEQTRQWLDNATSCEGCG
jgi:hypothetical protein